MEQRRRRAVALLLDDHPVAIVAQRVGATPRSVRRWLQMYEDGGDQALSAKSAPGRPSKLSPRQKDGLRRRLLKGAKAQGFTTDLWTLPRVRDLIKRCYGVTYHVDHLGRLLHELNFSPSEA